MFNVFYSDRTFYYSYEIADHAHWPNCAVCCPKAVAPEMAAPRNDRRLVAPSRSCPIYGRLESSPTLPPNETGPPMSSSYASFCVFSHIVSRRFVIATSLAIDPRLCRQLLMVSELGCSQNLNNWKRFKPRIFEPLPAAQSGFMVRVSEVLPSAGVDRSHLRQTSPDLMFV